VLCEMAHWQLDTAAESRAEQSKATGQAHPSREWRLSLWYPEIRDPESSLPEALSDKQRPYYTHQVASGKPT
jgi:hypothetical protein